MQAYALTLTYPFVANYTLISDPIIFNQNIAYLYIGSTSKVDRTAGLVWQYRETKKPDNNGNNAMTKVVSLLAVVPLIILMYF